MGKGEHMRRRQLVAPIAMMVFGGIGFVFSAVSAYDFITHLDRQVHPITCSAMPGLGQPDESGESGCFAAMMSPYSSVFRAQTWGGVPIALPAMSVFAYLVFMAFEILHRRVSDQRSEMAYAVAAAGLPVAASVFYFLVSVLHVGAVCTNCIGIYIASAGAFAAALIGLRAAGEEPEQGAAAAASDTGDSDVSDPSPRSDSAPADPPQRPEGRAPGETGADQEIDVGAGVEIDDALLDNGDEWDWD